MKVQQQMTKSTNVPQFHPMLVLREATRSGVYVRAPNGQPNCDDRLARMLGTLTGPQVVAVCVIALDLPVNPYPHLNLGQQSMNLRNRLRAALNRGDFGFGVVEEAIEEVTTNSRNTTKGA
jgi:hypothetical protein